MNVPLSPPQITPVPAEVVSGPDWPGIYEAAGSGEKISLLYYRQLLRRYWRRILAAAVLGTVLVFLATLSARPRYQADAMMRIDPAAVINVSDTSPTTGRPESEMLVETERTVATSPAVIVQVIERLHLAENPEFQPSSWEAKSLRTPGERQAWLLRAVARQITASNPPGTLLLDLEVSSHSPQLSTDIANALARALVEHDYQTRAEAQTDSTQSIAVQLTALRAKAEKAQNDLVEYESKYDVLDPDDRTNIMQSRLSQLNAALSKAQTDRMQLQSALHEATSGNMDSLLAEGGDGQLPALKQQLLEDKRKLNQLSTIYGPNNPVYQQQMDLVARGTQALQAEQEHALQQLRSQYAAAYGQEQLLQQGLNVQKRAMDDFNLKAVRYNLLKTEAESDVKLLYELEQRMQDASVSANLRSEAMRVISPARVPDQPYYPRIALTTGLAFFVFLLLGAGLTVLIGALDRTVSTPEQVDQWFGLPLLAATPEYTSKSPVLFWAELWNPGRKTEGTPSVHASWQAYRETITTLQSAIRFSLAGSGGSTLAVTSSLPGEGKSTLTSNLAGSFASMGSRVLLIDTDLRKPSVHRILGLTNRYGLAEVLAGTRHLGEVVVPSGRANLDVLTAGNLVGMPAQALFAGLHEVVEEARTRYEIVLLDCPPILGFADAVIVGRMADSMILVVRAASTDRQLVQSAIRQLRTARVNLTGAVLNAVNSAVDSQYGYYSSYGYSKYYLEAEDGE